VIVLCEDFLVYKSYPVKTELRCKYPRRLGVNSKEGVLISCSALMKLRGLFFYIIQNEFGDLFKVTLNYTNKDVHSVSVQYLDTIHPATSICILRSGYLFAAADSGNQYARLTQHLLEVQDARRERRKREDLHVDRPRRRRRGLLPQARGEP